MGEEVVGSRGFLLRCLSRAGVELDIVEDIADAVESEGLSAVSLAAGTMAVEEASKRLFLTGDEVVSVYRVCRELCAKEGVIVGPPQGGASLKDDNLMSGEDEDAERAAGDQKKVVEVATSEDGLDNSERLEPKEKKLQPSGPPTISVFASGSLSSTSIIVDSLSNESTRGDKCGKKQSSLSKVIMGTHRSDMDNTACKDSDEKTEKVGTESVQQCKGVGRINRMQQDKDTPEYKNMRDNQHNSRCVESSPAVEICKIGSKNSQHKINYRNSSSEEEEVRMDAGKTWKSHQRPSSAPSMSFMKATACSKGKCTIQLQQPELPPTVVIKRPKSAPGLSILRPTASSQAKKRQGDDKENETNSPSGDNPDCYAPSKPPASAWRKASASLLRPTQASKLRMMKDGDEDRPMTTEEMQFEQAKKEAMLEKRKLRRKPVSMFPQPVNSSPIEIKSTWQRLQQKPFRLLSVERHEHAMEMFKQTIAAERTKEDLARQFKARGIKAARTPPTKQVSEIQPKMTVPKGPRLASADRARRWKEVLDPQKASKDAAQRRAKEEKHKTAEAAIEKMMRMSRKGLTHKAKPMPDFSYPFKPDLTQAAMPTIGRGPSFATDVRFGKRDCGATGMSSLAGLYADPLGSTDGFSTTLRN